MATIRRKPSGKWEVDAYIGKQRKRLSFSSKSEAEAFRRELLLRPLDQLTGYASLKIVTVREAVAKYKERVWHAKSPETRVLEERYFASLERRFATLSIDQITSEDIEAFQKELRDSLQASTVNRHFNLYRNFFRKCEEWGHTRHNPCKEVSNLKDVSAKKPRVLSTQEVQLVLSAASESLRGPLLLMVRAGMRRKEVAHLLWGSVDTSAKRIVVESTPDFHPKGFKARVLPMSEELLAFFRKHRESAFKAGKASSGDRVFLNANGLPWRLDSLTKEVTKLGRRVGLKMSPHPLRHTFCTDLARANQNLEKVRKLAGHSSLRVTERYLHLEPEDLRSSMEEVSKIQGSSEESVTVGRW